VPAGIQPVNRLVRVDASEINERITSLACVDSCYDAFDGGALSDVLWSFRVRNNR